jgi:hypothetical protein
VPELSKRYRVLQNDSVCFIFIIWEVEGLETPKSGSASTSPGSYLAAFTKTCSGG